ncbi:MAG: response regulator transcription factor, partial [Myxococcota bacterium]
VEDAVQERSFLQDQLGEDGFVVSVAARTEPALDLLERLDPALVLLDAALPDASGFEICRIVRDGAAGRRWNRAVPLIMVSDRGSAEDRVRAFARGADDYVLRPFVYAELLARMRAVLRRSNGHRRDDRIVVSDLEIDRLSRVVRVGGQRVCLSAKEFELLVALAEDPLRVCEKQDLLRDVWGFRSAGRTRTLDSHASRLRRKLNGDHGDRFVINVWGVGYQLLAP